jgi:hypothetical protein
MKPEQETDRFATARRSYLKHLILLISMLIVSSLLAPFSLSFVFLALLTGLIDYFFTLFQWKQRTGAWSHIPGVLWSGLSVAIVTASESFAEYLFFPQISGNSFARWTLLAQFLSCNFAFSTGLLLFFRSKTEQYLPMEKPDLGTQN